MSRHAWIAALLLAACGSVSEGAPDAADDAAGTGGAAGTSSGGTAGAGKGGSGQGRGGAGGGAGRGGTTGGAGTTGAAGRGGTTGTAGAAGTGVITRPPTIETKNTLTSPISAISASVRVWNNDAMPLALSRLALRYWYTVDATAPAAQAASCTYANNITCAAAAFSFAAVAPRPSGAADAYLEIKFAGAGGVAPSGAASIELGLTWSKNDGSAFLQSNDWSGFASTDFAGNPHVTAYIDGALVAGTEP